jgi:hypothetical protein
VGNQWKSISSKSKVGLIVCLFFIFLGIIYNWF